MLNLASLFHHLAKAPIHFNFGWENSLFPSLFSQNKPLGLFWHLRIKILSFRNLNRKSGTAEGDAQTSSAQFHACTVILPRHVLGSTTFSTSERKVKPMWNWSIGMSTTASSRCRWWSHMYQQIHAFLIEYHLQSNNYVGENREGHWLGHGASVRLWWMSWVLAKKLN
jgi:hypothetical protein